MRKIFISLILSLLATLSYADGGMWLPSLISQRIGDMQSKGFKLGADDIYSINQASLKDAVVLFGGGCTGELISPEGLLLTNHHCGYGQIQKHSSVEHDYLKDGFWAMTRDEELPNPGLSVSFLDRMEDVTDLVLKGYDSKMTENERAELVSSNSKTLAEAATDKEKGLRASVEALYYGNQYFLFVYRQYSDIRLVGAPPSSVGKFGGETDNWIWPRHTGDFSMFRVYADKDNNPASYSKDNVPYHPRKFFKISTSGVHENDFTFIYGFPGSTQEYIHSEGVRYIAEISDPAKIKLRTLRLDVMDKYMAGSQDIRIRYSSKKSGVANAWKKWQGEAKGINRRGTVASKQAFEKKFAQWAQGSQYEGLTDRIATIYNQLEPLSFANDYYSETVNTIEIAKFAQNIANLYTRGNFSKERLDAVSATFFKDYYLPIDKECFIAVMDEYMRSVPENLMPGYVHGKMTEYGNAAAWAEDLFGKSLFTDPKKVAALTESSKDEVLADPAVIFMSESSNWFNENIRSERQKLNQELQLAYRAYMRGQIDYAEAAKGPSGKDAFYPDANLTLRVAYGHISGYSPVDGVYYKPSSTLTGIIEKDNPEIFDYNIPQKLRDIYAAKDFGRWANENGEVPVCFIATNHTTGGNSGSPVINADGNLIGINFDRVWEGTMSDIAFDMEFCRNIALDVRFVLFTLDKVAGARHILDELVLTE